MLLTILFFLFVLFLLACLPTLKRELFRIRLERARGREFKYFDGRRATTLEKYYLVNSNNVLANIWGIGVLFGRWPYSIDVGREFTILDLLQSKKEIEACCASSACVRAEHFKRIDFGWRDYRRNEDSVAYAFLVNEDSNNAKQILLKEFEKHANSRSSFLTFGPIWI